MWTNSRRRQPAPDEKRHSWTADPYSANGVVRPPAETDPPVPSHHDGDPFRPPSLRDRDVATLSWGSVTEFFSKPSVVATANGERFQMASLNHFPTLGGGRHARRRDSDTIHLGSDRYLQRPLASGTGRLRGAVASVAGAVRRLRPDRGLERNASLTSFTSPRHGWNDDDHIYQEYDPPMLKQPTLASPIVARNTRERHSPAPSLLHTRQSMLHPPQMPISPPPAPIVHDLSSFLPLVPDRPNRQSSGYAAPGSRRPPAPRVDNPFATPFDGENE